MADQQDSAVLMRYPNLRYGNPTELAYYCLGRELVDVARQLRRDERTVRDYLSGATRVPWWIPELLRLKRMEQDLMARQMGLGPLRAQFGLASGAVLELARPPEKKKPQLTELRLSDFDQASPTASKSRPNSSQA